MAGAVGPVGQPGWGIGVGQIIKGSLDQRFNFLQGAMDKLNGTVAELFVAQQQKINENIQTFRETISAETQALQEAQKTQELDLKNFHTTIADELSALTTSLTKRVDEAEKHCIDSSKSFICETFAQISPDVWNSPSCKDYKK